jgi:aminoglycoside phosphotransferase (APT) family kinase protein
MQINPTDRYLHLLRHTLRTTLLPELSTGAAKAAAGMMEAVLDEMLKREEAALPLLQQSIARGEALAAELAQALQQPVTVPAQGEAHFAALARIHAQLTERLAALCTALAERPMAAASDSDLLRRVAEWECDYYRDMAALPAPQPALEPSAGQPLTQERLQQYLEETEGAGVTLTRFEPLTGGFGKQTFLCEYQDAAGRPLDFVVRKTDPTPISSFGACNLESEYALLRTLAEFDYPAPKPQRFADHWRDLDGSFYTMPRIPGATPGAFLSGLHGSVDEAVLLELAELLGRLHCIPFDAFADYIQRYDDPRMLQADISECYRCNLDGWSRYMAQQTHLPSPYLAWLLRWLQQNIPADARRPILVHGDFNIHNVLVHEGRIRGVLDWECAGFGAPEQDLAYIQPHVARHIDWRRFLDHYLAHGGSEPRPDLMRFGMAYAALRTNLAGNRATWNLQRGANSDVRYAMVELGFTRSFMELALDSTNGENGEERCR